MADSKHHSSLPEMYGEPGLERFIDRLKPGMELAGRIIDVLNDNIIILRIWGNNILTETNHSFQKYDEVILHVQATHPKLVFRIQPVRQKKNGALYA